MEIKATSFSVDPNSTIKSLSIYFELYYLHGEEAPVSISGRMQTDDLKIVALLFENYIVQGTSYELNSKEHILSDKKSVIQQVKHGFYLTAQLSKESITHIESVREKNGDKSVHLIFDLVVKYFSTKSKQYPISSPTILNLVVSRLQTDIRISQTTWLKACAPCFEIGNFLLLELRLPENLQVKEFWYTLYSAAANNVHEMERYIRIGDWENTLREARRFFENIKIGDSKTGNTKFKHEFNKLMNAAGHTPEGIGNLHDAIWQLFEFTSKYVHEKDKNGNLKPIIVTSKEDAYFAMSICVGLLNLIGRKISI